MGDKLGLATPGRGPTPLIQTLILGLASRPALLPFELALHVNSSHFLEVSGKVTSDYCLGRSVRFARLPATSRNSS
jgi:hypothetical protein